MKTKGHENKRLLKKKAMAQKTMKRKTYECPCGTARLEWKASILYNGFFARLCTASSNLAIPNSWIVVILIRKCEDGRMGRREVDKAPK